MSRFTIRSRRSSIIINGNIVMETKTYAIIPFYLYLNTVRKSTPLGMHIYFTLKIKDKYIKLFRI